MDHLTGQQEQEDNQSSQVDPLQTWIKKEYSTFIKNTLSRIHKIDLSYQK
jgi:hypothetical protein